MQNSTDVKKEMPRGHGVKENVVIQSEGKSSNEDSAFTFSRLFSIQGKQPIALKLSTCEAIGKRMTSKTESDRKNSELPAGYTYFGQFVDHDLSLDKTESEEVPKIVTQNSDEFIGEGETDDPSTQTIESTPIGKLFQDRSPSLDLDSLYGSTEGADPILMDGFKFKLGTTSPSPGITISGRELRDYDLPRFPQEKSGKARKAMIGDGRNDENLAVAQIHLMWLKFHNAMADRVQIANPTLSKTAILEEARRMTTLHYQWIVLHDFVKRYIDEDVFKDIITNGKRRLLQQCHAETACMPLEFSVAVYRHGHSQVREAYDWNSNFGEGPDVNPIPGRQPGDASFKELFEFSQVSGNFLGLPTLPTNWLPDMRRLFDLKDEDLPNLEGSHKGKLNFARKIDPFLAPALGSLPEIERLVTLGVRPFANLAALNLRRGSMRGLLSGQDVSRELPNAKMLTKTEMRSVLDNDFDKVMTMNGLYDRTPLWLYILIEAAVRNDGNRMGDVGSIITAEVFVNLITTSRASILKPTHEWTPEAASDLTGSSTPLDSIAAILVWLDKQQPIINPLEDKRLTATA